MIRVGIIRGGTGPEYFHSLEAGSYVLNLVQNDLAHSHQGIDILITRDGVWHIRGKEVNAGDIVSSVDVLLSLLSAPQHTGLFSFSEIGLPVVSGVMPHFHQTPKTILIADLMRNPEVTSIENMAGIVSQKLPPPWLIRLPGQSLPFKTVKTREELARLFALHFQKVSGGTIESLAFGEDIAVLVTDTFRGEHPYAFPPVVLGSYSFSGYTFVKPRLLGGVDAREITARAKELYITLGLKHLTSIHFTRAKDGIHVGAIESNPLLHPLRYMPIALEAVGSKMPEFLKHAIDLVKG